MPYDISFTEYVVTRYPEFKIEDFEYDQRSDKLLRYTIYLFDIGSELRTIADPEKRKKEACKRAGLLRIPDNEILRKIQRHFLKVQGNKKYELLISGEELFSQLMETVRQRVKFEKNNPEKEIKTYEIKTKCFHEAVKIESTISELENDLFSGGKKENGEEKKKKDEKPAISAESMAGDIE